MLIHILLSRGALAEELGIGLQNLVRGCESRTRLHVESGYDLTSNDAMQCIITCEIFADSPLKIQTSLNFCTLRTHIDGRVAELVYAADLKSVPFGMRVRPPPCPPRQTRFQPTRKAANK